MAASRSRVGTYRGCFLLLAVRRQDGVFLLSVRACQNRRNGIEADHLPDSMHKHTKKNFSNSVYLRAERISTQ